MAYQEYKNCPYCDQTIEANDQVCKHCQSSLVDETSPAIYDFPEESPDDDLLTLEVRCPKCNSYIPEDAPFCESCRGRGFWKEGKTKFNTGFTIHHSGCNLNSCGCLLPLLLVLIIIIAATGGC